VATGNRVPGSEVIRLDEDTVLKTAGANRA